MTDKEIVVRLSTFADFLRRATLRSTDVDLQRWHAELEQFTGDDSEAVRDFVGLGLFVIRGEIAARYKYQSPLRQGFYGPNVVAGHACTEGRASQRA
jgi:hypothetical protein